MSYATRDPNQPPKTPRTVTQPAARPIITINDIQDDLSEISKAELVEALKPEFATNTAQQKSPHQTG